MIEKPIHYFFSLILDILSCCIILSTFICIYSENYVYIISISRRTLVICDSRGRQVRSMIRNPDVIFQMFPGATLTGITSRVIGLVKRYKPISCMILIGVNDLTWKNRFNRKVRPRRLDSFHLANDVIKKVLKLRAKIRYLFPSLKLVFGGLNGIHINKYNKVPGHSAIQKVIDECVTQFNCYIRLLNRFDGNYHPRLTSKIHTWRRGRRVNRYHMLPDGLHFGDVVNQSWITAIGRFHRINSLGLTK